MSGILGTPGSPPAGRTVGRVIRIGIVIAKIPGEQGVSTNPPLVVRYTLVDMPQFGQAGR
ncbi:hypothetical protein GCM10017668_23850 [Streptomyces tuirus]|uniref:Uncharacterized protein n=1 Tax=Streptomyces tuirus TaxID=68278 RepID=A0A7G1NEB4_9ACTN|nr:hypothetical protein GCM10017668_23850 [Streptomyces tuirus]